MDKEEIEALNRDGKVFKSSPIAPVTATVGVLLKSVGLLVLIVASPIVFVFNHLTGGGGSKPSGSSQLKEEKFSKLTGVTPLSMGERKYDIVLFGSTGFTGRLAAIYVAKTYGKSDLRWAIGKEES